MRFVHSTAAHLRWAAGFAVAGLVAFVVRDVVADESTRYLIAATLWFLAARQIWNWRLWCTKELDARRRVVRIAGHAAVHFDDVELVEHVLRPNDDGVNWSATVRLRTGRFSAILLYGTESETEAASVADQVAFTLGKPVVTRRQGGLVWIS